MYFCEYSKDYVIVLLFVALVCLFYKTFDEEYGIYKYVYCLLWILIQYSISSSLQLTARVSGHLQLILLAVLVVMYESVIDQQSVTEDSIRRPCGAHQF